MAYYTYGIGTRRNQKVYLLSDIKPQRVWTKKLDNALTFYTEEEAQFVIQKFKIPNCALARIKHNV
jgi:hypothetical protein